MKTPRILLLEDSDIDAELISIHLERAQMPFAMVRAARRAEFEQALGDAGQSGIDLVLADYSLPDFDGLAALEMAKAHLPDVPFVFVSGIGGEDLATDALRRGATDYVLKRNLARLPGSLRRALAEARERRQRRRAESALVKSEANMRLAVDAAQLGLWQFANAEGALRWDDRCQHMFDLPGRARLLYAEFLSRLHQADRAGMDQAMQAALDENGNSLLVHECRVLAADGSVRWVVMRGQRLATAGAAGAVLTGVLQDISATRLLEARQRHTEVLFRLAAQATGLGIWELGPEHDQIWVDDNYRAMAALPPDDAPGYAELLQKAVHPDDRTPLATALNAAFAHSAEAEVDLEHRLVGVTDGRLRWVAVKGRRITGIDGRARLVGTVRDITEQRRLQEALRESNLVLEARMAERTRELTNEIAERGRVEDTLRQMQRLEAVGQLTSGVAHDFNNLLMVVVSNISLINKLLLQQPPVDERILKRLTSMREAATRGATLTRQLLAFSRRQRLEPQTVDFNEIVLGMRDLLQTTLGGSVHLQTDLSEQLWPALVDPTQMELIILNLAINARDAMEVGGSLCVRTDNVTLDRPPARPEEPEPGDYVALSVIDTGSGMSPEVLAKAFEPFFTTKEVGKGSGLGLAQVYGFAKQSGGGVRIDTRPGEGSSVHVFMPRSREPLALPDGARQGLGVSTAGPAPSAGSPGPAGSAGATTEATRSAPDSSPCADASQASAKAGCADADRIAGEGAHVGAGTGKCGAASSARQSGPAVLVVDDDHAVREATASLLQLHGFRVSEAADGASALAQASERDDLALVLADFAMPRMNGAELARELRVQRPDLPVIFMTGFAELGALDGVPEEFVLQKPIDDTALVARLRRLLS